MVRLSVQFRFRVRISCKSRLRLMVPCDSVVECWVLGMR